MRILSVVSIMVEKKSGYGYLEEIVISRADQKLYKLKKGNFPDLHLDDIEDMLLLIAQNKLFNLDGDVIVDFVIALKMFTRGIIVKNRIEDVQLGVESYQRKLNLTKPQRTCQHISVKEPYTPNFDPPRIMPPRKAPRTRTTPATTTNTTSVTNAQLQAMIDQGVAAALATRDANRSTNGEDSHNSGTGVRRTERVARECTYQDFMKCQPLFFKGTEGVVKLTQWFERMEIVFRISNCTVENQIKFSTCTLLGVALTWWNSHVRTVGHDVAYAMTWTDLKKKMTDKIQSTFPGETGIVCRQDVSGRLIDLRNMSVVWPDMLPNISTLAERQAENKRKLDNNNQAQQQSPKRQNVAQAYAAGTGKRKEYAGTLPCATGASCHIGPCPELKNQNHGNQAEGTGARGLVHALGGGEADQDLNDMEDDIML
ncbi:hypothetical protein Tco_0828882 [Tanacetum coccineum]